MFHAIRRSSLVLLVAMSAVGANAQEATGGIAAVLNSLSLLQSNLAALQTSVTALSSQSQTNVRYTPLVNVNTVGELAGCAAINVSTSQRTVRCQIVNLDGVTLEDSGNRVLEPGHGSGTGNSRGFLYCKFTVVNGTRADIRAGMSVCTNAACREDIPADWRPVAARVEFSARSQASRTAGRSIQTAASVRHWHLG